MLTFCGRLSRCHVVAHQFRLMKQNGSPVRFNTPKDFTKSTQIDKAQFCGKDRRGGEGGGLILPLTMIPLKFVTPAVFNQLSRCFCRVCQHILQQTIASKKRKTKTTRQ